MAAIDRMARIPYRQPAGGMLPGELMDLRLHLPKRSVADVSACAVLCAIAAAQTYGLMSGEQLSVEAEKAADQWVMRGGPSRRRWDFQSQMIAAYVLATVDPPSFHTMVKEVWRV